MNVESQSSVSTTGSRQPGDWRKCESREGKRYGTGHCEYTRLTIESGGAVDLSAGYQLLALLGLVGPDALGVTQMLLTSAVDPTFRAHTAPPETNEDRARHARGTCFSLPCSTVGLGMRHGLPRVTH